MARNGLAGIPERETMMARLQIKNLTCVGTVPFGFPVEVL
jgi:hypothetical protein